MFSSRFMLFPTFQKKNCVNKISGGGGGVVLKNIFFFRKQFFLISRFILFSTLKNNNIEMFPFTYWLNGRWFLLYSLVMILYLKYGGGAVMFFSHFMLFPTFIKKKIWEYKTIISHLMFCSCFFVCWKYCKVPLHLQLLVKWEVVSPNSR